MLSVRADHHMDAAAICGNDINVKRRPWESAPYQLIGWWDMEQFGAHIFYAIAKVLEQKKYEFNEKTNVNDPTPKIELIILKNLHVNCQEIGLRISCGAIQETINSIKDGYCNILAYKTDLDRISDLIWREMKNELFMYVPPKRAERYNQIDGFGVAVNKSFPSASFDIIESGNCFSVGRFTSCVFHLMRALEVGLSAFAGTFGVCSDRKNWQNILMEIERSIKAMGSKQLTSDEKQKHEFYAQAASNFMFFKDAWRNYTAHARGKYTEEEADMIYRNVQSFMNKLAEGGISETP